jgi:anti-sigma-K factor RskA
MNERIEALFVPYSLGLLSPEERQRVEQYVARHPEAENRLANILEDVFTVEVEDIVPMEPAPATRDALFARVDEDVVGQESAARPAPRARSAAPPRHQKSPSFWEWLTGRITMPTLATATLAAVAIVVLGVWANSLAQRVADQEETVAALSAERSALDGQVSQLSDEVSTLREANEQLQQTRTAQESRVANLEMEIGGLQSEIGGLESEVVALQTELSGLEGQNDALLAQIGEQQRVTSLFESPHVHTVALEGTEVTPDAEGQLVVDPASPVALLIISQLPPLDEGLEYQVLLIYGDAHDTGETFRVSTDGQEVVVVEANRAMEGFDHIGISIEPAGGSPQRTGEIVMLAPLPQG